MSSNTSNTTPVSTGTEMTSKVDSETKLVLTPTEKDSTTKGPGILSSVLSEADQGGKEEGQKAEKEGKDEVVDQEAQGEEGEDQDDDQDEEDDNKESRAPANQGKNRGPMRGGFRGRGRGRGRVNPNQGRGRGPTPTPAQVPPTRQIRPGSRPEVRIPVTSLSRRPSIGRLIVAINRMHREIDSRMVLRFIESQAESDDDYATGYVLVASEDIEAVSYISKRVRMELENLIWDEETQHPKKPVVHRQQVAQARRPQPYHNRRNDDEDRLARPPRYQERQQQQQPQQQQRNFRNPNQPRVPWYQKKGQEPEFEDEDQNADTPAAAPVAAPSPVKASTSKTSGTGAAMPQPSMTTASSTSEVPAKTRVRVPIIPRKVLGPSTKLTAPFTGTGQGSVWADADDQ